MSHNKLATVDNLNKREMSKPVHCQFCGEHESVSHLFFECCVARVICGYAAEFLRMEIGSDYISVASQWLSEKIMYH
jgi:hypothetical protein